MPPLPVQFLLRRPIDGSRVRRVLCVGSGSKHEVDRMLTSVRSKWPHAEITLVSRPETRDDAVAEWVDLRAAHAKPLRTLGQLRRRRFDLGTVLMNGNRALWRQWMFGALTGASQYLVFDAAGESFPVERGSFGRLRKAMKARGQTAPRSTGQRLADAGGAVRQVVAPLTRGLTGHGPATADSTRERIPCPLCKSDGPFDPIYIEGDSDVVRCSGCGLAHFNPLPTAEHLADYYSTDDGYLPSIRENLAAFERDPGPWEASAAPILDKLQQHGLPDGGRILDVGCAWGFFLQRARAHGFDVHGLELSRHTSQWAREQGIDVRTGHLGTTDYEPGSFDAITINNVLEHSIHPLEDLNAARRLLTPGGLFYVAVPNMGSLVAEADGYYWKMKSWPNHLFYFDEATLTRALEQAGFEVVQAFSHNGEADIADDRRVIRDRYGLDDDDAVEAKRVQLQAQGLAQELVLVGRNPA